MYKYDKDKIKENLSIEQVMDLLTELGGEPILNGDTIISKTICHNEFGVNCSHKLYYYDNSHLFNCYTNCGSFDIFQLVCNIKNINEEYKIYYNIETGKMATKEWTLNDALEFVAVFYGFSYVVDNFSNEYKTLPDEEVFNRYNKISLDTLKTEVKLNVFESNFLLNLPMPHIAPWEKEGVLKEVMDSRGIRYDAKAHGIVIPHYNEKGELIGVRERTLVKEEEQYGKYKPAIIGGKMYNHPLGFNLYNLNFSKNNISNLKKAIIFEGEKSSLLFASLFGMENDISVACCGSNLTNYQILLLKNLGVQEIVIGFDRQFKEVGDDEWNKWIKKLEGIHQKYSKDVQISFMFDKNCILGYKDSPIDCGKEKFLQLFNERIYL